MGILGRLSKRIKGEDEEEDEFDRPTFEEPRGPGRGPSSGSERGSRGASRGRGGRERGPQRGSDVPEPPSEPGEDLETGISSREGPREERRMDREELESSRSYAESRGLDMPAESIDRRERLEENRPEPPEPPNLSAPTGGGRERGRRERARDRDMSSRRSRDRGGAEQELPSLPERESRGQESRELPPPPEEKGRARERRERPSRGGRGTTGFEDVPPTVPAPEESGIGGNRDMISTELETIIDQNETIIELLRRIAKEERREQRGRRLGRSR